MGSSFAWFKGWAKSRRSASRGKKLVSPGSQGINITEAMASFSGPFAFYASVYGTIVTSAWHQAVSNHRFVR